jgi:uncharacterized protein YyaL (SSP411 family)
MTARGRIAIAAVMLVTLAGAGVLWRRTVTPAPVAEPLRTRHRNADGTPTYTNRLAAERSPYLRQHAHNPVDWYPWGDEAFAKARAERKPILLSIGYSTCHWCHVMEEESFEDDEIAAYLNAHYVAIKVDREERPDVDAVYMNAVQLMTDGGGGWPMTVWLTPERKPFYGGTYFPPRAGVRGARLGFLELLTRLAEAWTADPARVETAAADVVGRLEAEAGPAADASMPGADALDRADAELAATFDAQHGGFGTRPKFPRPSDLFFLLRQHRRTARGETLEMVVRTLHAIETGGIHDHVGGGFHRYATDAAWRVPHYEKMLYDNALLAMAFLETFQTYGRRDHPEFGDAVRSTLAYLLRDMRAPDGGFFAASDADSDGDEGAYYLWTRDELERVVGPERAGLAAAYFGVENEPSTLTTVVSLATLAESHRIRPDVARREIDEARRRLLEARSGRVAPHVDRKVVVAWNGLAVSVFARAGVVLREPAWIDVARDTAARLLDARRGERLPRYLLDGEAHGDGYLDDHAFLAAGLLDLYEATFDARWLREAIALQGVLDEHFADPRGGYFLTADDHETLLTREKPDYDGAEPTGNSMALSNLLRLAELTTDDRYRARADGVLTAFADVLAHRPSALPYMLCGLAFRLDRVLEIVIVTPDDGRGAAPFVEQLASRYVPSHVLAVVTAGAPSRALAQMVPLVADKTLRDGRPTAYVCEQHVCKLPTTDPERFGRFLYGQEP